MSAGAIVNGRIHIERLESLYGFECQGGPLANCDDWDGLKRCFEHLAELAAAPKPFDQLPLAESRLSIAEMEKWINVLDQLLRYAGAPGDWGYGSKLGLLTKHLIQVRQEIVREEAKEGGAA